MKTTFVKAKLVKMNKCKLINPLDYGWLMKIESFEQLMTYHDKVHSTRLQEAYADWVRMDDPINKGDHCRNNLTASLWFLASITSKSMPDAIAKFSGDVTIGQLKSLEKYGAIYIQRNGSWFPPMDGLEIYDEEEKVGFTYPSEQITKVFKWPQGSHYYATIDDVPVVSVDGKEKWNTVGEAEHQLKLALRRLKRQNKKS
jgi:hypothetical protein